MLQLLFIQAICIGEFFIDLTGIFVEKIEIF